MQMKNIIIVVAALAAGVAAGWLAGGVGRARCPQRADGGGLGQAPLPAERSNATAQIHEEIEVRAEDAADDLMAETSMLMGLSVEKCARERGFSDEDAAAIAETYRAIYEATTVVF